MVGQGTEYGVIAELQNPLMRGLACAALSPGLRSLLVFDASPTTLQTMSGLLAQVVAVVTRGEVVVPQSRCSKSERRIVPIQLGTVETEEELWGSLSLNQEDFTTRTVVWKPGLLASGRGQETRIVVIPDLSRLSLVASRACVMLMDSEVAHLERHGQHDRWQPQLYWLAGCDRTRIGTLSPHLLDRFSLRLSGGDSPNSAQRVTQLRMWFEQFDHMPSLEERRAELPPLSAEVVDCLKNAQLLRPEILPEARERVLDYVEVTDGYSTRRDLALLRLAKAIAQMKNFTVVTRDAVDEAASMIGLSLQQKLPEMPLSDSKAPEPETKDGVPQLDSSALNQDQSELTKKAPTLVG